jgi:hypothetical protein
MKKIKNFLNRLRPKSDQELMMDYLSEAKDTAQLEYMMKQWDARMNRRHW